jgi:hypothetical protein
VNCEYRRFDVKKNTAVIFLRGSFFIAAALVWTACPNPADETTGNPDQEKSGGENNGVPMVTDPGDTADAALVPASKDISDLGLANPLIITFSEAAAAPTVKGGTNATASPETNHVTVTLTASGADIVAQGINAEGSLTFSGDYDFNLYLNGLGLTSSGGGAINNDGTGTMKVTLVEKTENRLIDGAGGSQKAAFYSKGDFTITGGGTLEVRGKTAHAIAAKGAFTQSGGTIRVKESVKDGINAKTVSVSGGAFTARTKGDGIQGDSGVTITGGTFTIITTADDVKAHGIKSDENIAIGGSGGSAPGITVTVYGSGSKCISADGDITVSSGNLTLNTAGDGYWDTTAEEDDKTTACAGIKCDGDLLIKGGALTIVSTGTGGKGISVDGDIIIDGGTLDVTTAGATYVYSAAYDTKSKAIKSDNNLTINDGTLSIKTYTDGAEGLECEYTLTINGGTIEINSYDDAINASGGDDGKSGSIIITGGKIFCNSSGNDGIDSNGTIAVSGGTVIALGTTAPEEGFDCDNNPFTVTGGTLIGFGGATSKPTSAASKCAVECNVRYASLYHIEASDGTAIMTFEMPRTYSGTVCMLFGGGEMTRGTSYTLYSGGGVSGGSNFHGLYSGATYTKGSAVGTFTGSAYATVGTPSGSPPGPGQPEMPGGPAAPLI